MTQNVWESLLTVLRGCANKQIFGVFGDAINPLADALRKDKEKNFEWIAVRHEEVAAFAASAQAKITGKLGLCAGTVGPGAIHLLNGLYDAKMDHAPVLAMTGQIPRVEMGTDYHQEVNLDRLFDDVCVYNQTVIVSEQMPRLGLLAVQTALAKNGVAHLSIHSDVGPKNDITESLEHPVFMQHSKVIPCQESLEEIAELLNHADKITIFVGWGARGATTEIKMLAEKLKAPIVHTLKGKTVIAQDDPNWCGGTGMLGSRSGVYAMDECDVLFILGADFPYRQFYPKGKQIIQVDIAPERLGKRCSVKHGLIGHVQPTVSALLPLLKDHGSKTHLATCQTKRDEWLALMLKKAGRGSTKEGRLHPQTLAHAIDKYANDSAVFTADTGETIMWMARQIAMKGDRDFIASFNHATMANAMAHAIGIQALNKTRQVIAMCGDGGFSMLMGDFITAVTYALPIKIFVFNNGILGLVKMEMEATGYVEWGIRLKNPSFADCAKAMGGEGIRVENRNDLDAAVKRAFEIKGPVVVDVLTNPEELTIPPKIEAARAWGFSVSKMKELWAERE